MDTAEYHWYLTNLQVPAQLIYPLYRNRWQIELLFKSLKSSFHLNEIPSNNPVLIENLVLANLIASVIGSSVYQASQSNQKATLEPVLKPTQNPKLFSIQGCLT
jgi:IS4 transposase